MADVTFRVDGWQQALKVLRLYDPARVVMVLKQVMGVQLRLVVGTIRQKWLTGGTTDDKLATHTGKLKNSIRAGRITETAGGVNGAILAGTRYASTHFGKRGSSVTIHGKPWLTVPLSNIPESAKVLLTGAGALRGGARSGVFGETFIRKSRAGNLIIFGKRTVQRGEHAGETRGATLPLFILKRQVTVKRRVFTDEIGKGILDRIARDSLAILRRSEGGA